MSTAHFESKELQRHGCVCAARLWSNWCARFRTLGSYLSSLPLITFSRETSLRCHDTSNNYRRCIRSYPQRLYDLGFPRRKTALNCTARRVRAHASKLNRSDQHMQYQCFGMSNTAPTIAYVHNNIHIPGYSTNLAAHVYFLGGLCDDTETHT